MKMNKETLEAIIRDELTKYIEELDPRDQVASGPPLLAEPDLETEAARKPRTYLYAKEEDDTPFPGWDGRRGLKAMSRGIYQEAGKARKPNCSPGAPYHNQDGKFTDPSADKGSWSIDVDGTHSSDCQSGQGRRTSANKSVQFTKRRCGRGKGGKGKAKWKCKDGTPSHTPRHELAENQVELELEQQQQREIDCRPCWERFLKSINQANLAAKGDLMKKGK